MSELGEITLCWAITFERRSKHPPERMWAAIADPDEVSKWMRYPATIDLRVGGAYHVDFSRTNQGELDGVIVRVEAERTLAYVWGRSVIEWTFEPDGDGCRYTFRDHGTEAPTETDDYTSEGIASGWHGWLDALDAHLEGRPVTVAEEKATWEALKAPYRERLDASLSRD